MTLETHFDKTKRIGKVQNEFLKLTWFINWHFFDLVFEMHFDTWILTVSESSENLDNFVVFYFNLSSVEVLLLAQFGFDFFEIHVKFRYHFVVLILISIICILFLSLITRFLSNFASNSSVFLADNSEFLCWDFSLNRESSFLIVVNSNCFYAEFEFWIVIICESWVVNYFETVLMEIWEAHEWWHSCWQLWCNI